MRLHYQIEWLWVGRLKMVSQMMCEPSELESSIVKAHGSPSISGVKPVVAEILNVRRDQLKYVFNKQAYIWWIIEYGLSFHEAPTVWLLWGKTWKEPGTAATQLWSVLRLLGDIQNLPLDMNPCSARRGYRLERQLIILNEQECYLHRTTS